MKNKYCVPKEIIFNDTLESIPNVYELERLGAGHDGMVFRYNDKALKILKYDINLRKERKLMTFEKALYFKNNLNLKRIEKPRDILLDSVGVYTGYVMNFLDDITLDSKKGSPIYKQVGDFSCGDLIYVASELEEDFNELTKNRVLAKDINRGSYIFPADFLHLCDMDKYDILSNKSLGADDLNKRALHFTIAKLLYYEMQKTGNFDKLELKQLSNWVKKCSNSRTFLHELDMEARASDYSCPIGEFSKQKVKKIIS